MDKLLDFFGTREKAAEALGVTPSYLSMIKKGKRRFSPIMASVIDELTNGSVSKHYLRPDVFGEDRVNQFKQ